MLVMGGLQGGLGWFMVASGFAERTDVSQYRLVAHLVFALAIYAYVFWIALTLLYPAPAEGRSVRGLPGALAAVTALIAVTVASGGFVAGLDAGFVYNSFPPWNPGSPTPSITPPPPSSTTGPWRSSHCSPWSGSGCGPGGSPCRSGPDRR
jgi:heme A synthase